MGTSIGRILGTSLGRNFVECVGTLGDSLLGNLVIGKGTIRADEGTVRAGENF